MSFAWVKAEVKKRAPHTGLFTAFFDGAIFPCVKEVERRMKLLSSWFCPYAQRATVALNQRRITYEWVEALDWYPDESYRKSPLLLKHNPHGLIPTIVDDESGKVVYESLLCIEFADELPAPGPRLLPQEPWDRAQCRLKADWVNKKLCSPYYRVLVRREDQERR